MGAENYLQVMADSMKKKEAVLRKIISLNEEQQKLLERDDFAEDMLRQSIDAKGECIDELTRLDEGFQSLYNHVKTELEIHKDNYRDEIKEMKSLITRVTELSVKAEVQEKRNKQLMDGKLSAIRQNLSSAKKTASMANTYYQTMNKLNYEPQFMDQKK